MKLELSVNGRVHHAEVSPWRRLLDVLREDLALTGTKEGCGEGECGACTVLLDGEPVNSCLVTASQCQGRELLTVEGLAAERDGQELLHAVQRQLVACGGAQCGICTPGIAVCAKYVVDRGALAGVSDDAARAQVRELLAGNICRCTGYQLIVEAVVAAAREVAPDAPTAPTGGGPR
ncbi:MAG: (2Fe-2S)-binding protein [Kofleriaceae bacterium]